MSWTSCSSSSAATREAGHPVMSPQRLWKICTKKQRADEEASGSGVIMSYHHSLGSMRRIRKELAVGSDQNWLCCWLFETQGHSCVSLRHLKEHGNCTRRGWCTLLSMFNLSMATIGVIWLNVKLQWHQYSSKRSKLDRMEDRPKYPGLVAEGALFGCT
jgi:hypothetical protein